MLAVQRCPLRQAPGPWLAHSNGFILDRLNQAWVIISPAREIDPLRNWPHAQQIVWSGPQKLNASRSG